MLLQSSGTAIGLSKEISFYILLCEAIQGATVGIWKIREDQTSFYGINSLSFFLKPWMSRKLLVTTDFGKVIVDSFVTYRILGKSWFLILNLTS